MFISLCGRMPAGQVPSQREHVLVNVLAVPKLCSAEVVLIYNLTQQVLKVLASSGTLQKCFNSDLCPTST